MIRWVRDWLGTASYNDLNRGDWLIVDVRHHVDKAGNPSGALRQSIDTALAGHREGQRIVVACDFGISRSNAIAAGVLSRVEGCSFDDALSQVIVATGETQIKLEMIASVRAALGEAACVRPKNAILVTGGGGFIGRRLVASLSRTQAMLAPPRAELDLLRGGVALAQYCERRNIGQIVHLAYPRQYTNAAAVGESLTMLKGVLDVGKLLELRLIVLSSWVVFSGYATAMLLADESLPPRSKGTYGDAKLLEETLLNAYLRRGEVRAVLCRFAPIYGPEGERPRLIRTFAAAISAGRKVVTHRYRNGAPALDLLHVEDAVSALVAILHSDKSGIFHFGTGRLTETQMIARHLSGLLGARLEHEEMAIEDETSNIAMDASKALQQLGWQAKIGVEDGLADIVRSGGSGPAEPAAIVSRP